MRNYDDLYGNESSASAKVVVKDAEIMYDYRNNEICARYQRGQVKDYDGIVNLVECHKDDVLSVDAPFLVGGGIEGHR